MPRLLKKHVILALCLTLCIATAAFGDCLDDLMGTAVRKGLEWGADKFSQAVKDDDLYDAVYENVKSAAEIQALIDDGADVNARHTDQEMTPLIAAGYKNTNPDVIRVLVQAGADMNAKEKAMNMTAFMWACARNSNPEVIKVFLQLGADINSKTDTGTTVLMWAAGMNQNPEIINTLLNEGADVNAKRGGDKRTALMMAAWMNPNPYVVKTLLKAGADAGARDINGDTAKDYASENPNSTSIISTLEQDTAR